MPIYPEFQSVGGGFNTASDYTVTGNWEFNNTVVEVDAALVINGAATLYSDGGQFVWNDGGVQFDYAQNLIDQLQVNSNLTVNGPFSCDNNQIFSDGNGALYFADGNYGIDSNGGGYFYQFASDNGLISSDASGNLTTQTLYVAGTLLGYNQQTILDIYSNISTTGNITAGQSFYGDGSNLTNVNASNITIGTLDAARLPTAITPGSVSTGSLSITTPGSFPLSITSGGGFPASHFLYRGSSMLDLYSHQDLGIDVVSAPGEIQAGGNISTAGGTISGAALTLPGTSLPGDGSGSLSYGNISWDATGNLILTTAYQQTTDPAVPGQVWNNNGILTFSNG